MLPFYRLCCALMVGFLYSDAFTMANMAPPERAHTPGELLQQLRLKRGISSLREAGRRSGLSHTSIANFENAIGEIGMHTETARRLSRAYSVPRSFIDQIATGAIEALPDDLDSLASQEPSRQADTRVKGRIQPVRFLGSVSAGLDGDGIAAPVDYLAVADFFLKNYRADDVYALEVTGDSMISDDLRRYVPPGSIILVHEELVPMPGQIVVAWLENEDMGVLKVYEEHHGEVWLVSHNASHAPIKVDSDTPASLRGVMIAQWTKAPGI